MATKMINVKKLLQEKGYQPKPFDTNGFMTLVEKFFTEHPVEATLAIYPKRFADDPSAPDCGYIDMIDEERWSEKVEDDNDPFTFTDYIIFSNKGLIRPLIFVDEPYLENAVFALKLSGLPVKKRRSGKCSMYIVSLV